MVIFDSDGSKIYEIKYPDPPAPFWRLSDFVIGVSLALVAAWAWVI